MVKNRVESFLEPTHLGLSRIFFTQSRRTALRAADLRRSSDANFKACAFVASIDGVNLSDRRRESRPKECVDRFASGGDVATQQPDVNNSHTPLAGDTKAGLLSSVDISSTPFQHKLKVESSGWWSSSGVRFVLDEH
jgi:hypothetical protein